MGTSKKKSLSDTELLKLFAQEIVNTNYIGGVAKHRLCKQCINYSSPKHKKGCIVKLAEDYLNGTK